MYGFLYKRRQIKFSLSKYFFCISQTCDFFVEEIKYPDDGCFLLFTILWTSPIKLQSSVIGPFVERLEARSRREATRLDLGFCSQKRRFEIGRKVFGIRKCSRFFRRHRNRRNEMRMREVSIVVIVVRLKDQRCRWRTCSIKTMTCKLIQNKTCNFYV